MTLKEQTKRKIADSKALILQMISTQTNNDTNYNYGYLDSNLILHMLNVKATLSLSQSIVSTGDTITVNALVTDSDGNNVSDAPVQFYINDTASGNPIPTNSNGIATYTYTGTGIGKTQISAKIGSFVSETYGILDAQFYDKGLDGTGNYNDDWWETGGTLTISRSANGTLLTNSGSGNIVRYANIDGKGSYSQAYDYTPPFCVEMDIVSLTGTGYIYVYDGVSTFGLKTWETLGLTGSNHIKIVVEETQAKWYVDNMVTPKITNNVTFDKCGVGFRVNPDSNITYKEFKISPI